MKAQGTYVKWLFFQRGREDDIGDLARDAFMDPDWDGGLKTLGKIVKSNGSDLALASFDKSCHMYRDQRKAYYTPKVSAFKESDSD